MNKEMIEVLYARPGEKAILKVIKDDLEVLQEHVDGDIEILFWEDLVLIFNDEGKIINLPENRCLVNNTNGEILDVICGPLIICSNKGEELSSLTEEQKQKAYLLFGNAQAFIKTPFGVIVKEI